jgi:hypothetical protein
MWSFLTSILSSAVVGFGVAYFQTKVPEEQHRLLATDIVFLVLMIASALMTLAKRSRLSAKARKVRFRLGDQVSEENGI